MNEVTTHSFRRIESYKIRYVNRFYIALSNILKYTIKNSVSSIIT
jgi:hypothetical protein